MKSILPLILSLLFLQIPLMAQKPPNWTRVYTFDDSFIDMDSSRLTKNGDIVQATFRWIFEKPGTFNENPKIKYRTRSEVFEFDCREKRFRLNEFTLIDSEGKVVLFGGLGPVPEWSYVPAGSIIQKLYMPACDLANPQKLSPQDRELIRARQFASRFAARLDRAKDFDPLVKEFFAPNYLAGYLREQHTNWLFNLNRDTAAKATRAELRRFHVAMLNAVYLVGSYMTLKYQSAAADSLPVEQQIPPDVIRLIDNHSYTANFRRARVGYDHLADNIDTLGRLRSYTDLLERIALLWRSHLVETTTVQSRDPRSGESSDIGEPRVRSCKSECFGLPAGTKLFAVNIAVFGLQLAEINGQMKIVSVGEPDHRP